ncbi:hypothetical protein WDU94_005266 [Cyamophila willieti]
MQFEDIPLEWDLDSTLQLTAPSPSSSTSVSPSHPIPLGEDARLHRYFSEGHHDSIRSRPPRRSATMTLHSSR